MTITINAYFKDTPERPQHALITFNLTEEEANKLPKWLGLKATNGRNYRTIVKFLKDGVVGEKNETGIKKIRKLVNVGATFETSQFTCNAYASVEDFLAAL